MTTFIIILIVIAAFFFWPIKDKKGNNANSETKKDNAEILPCISLTVKGGDADGCFGCTIAGVKYRCDDSDIGGFVGYVQPEPTNEHDSDACAVYRHDHKCLGYIPRTELQAYRKWSELKTLPCVGFIRQGDTSLFGKVKIHFGPTDEYYHFMVIKYVRWLVANFGVKYIPEGFTVDGVTLKKKQEWLDYLDQEIEEREEKLFEEVKDED